LKTLILTVYDQKYQDYARLFRHCATRAYPEYDVLALDRSEVEREIGTLPDNKATTATLRFCLPDHYYAGYDHAYITDVDMLIYRENTPLREQHLHVMERTGYPYEDIAVPIQGHGYRMPGILFASQAWFDRTSETRAKLLKSLKSNDVANYYEFDEVSLFKLCEPFGYTKKGTEQWRWHGIHLGRYCRRPGKNRRMNIGISELAHVAELMADDEFVEIAAGLTPGGECAHTLGALADMCGAVA
jgi:hypothetical protein